MSSSREIRAPLPHVRSFALRLESVMAWVWAPAQVADPAANRDLPDGTRQLIVRDGDKLRTRIASREDSMVVVETSYQPRKSEIPGRDLRYELGFESGAGTTVVTLSLSFTSGAPAPGPGESRRWTRNVTQCLERLEELAVGSVDEDNASGTPE